MTPRADSIRRAWIGIVVAGAVVAGLSCGQKDHIDNPQTVIKTALVSNYVIPPANLGPGATLHQGGDAALKIAILGDGFTSANESQQKYRDAADAVAARLLQHSPFSVLPETLTILRVDVVSDGAGIDVPESCDGVAYNIPGFAFARAPKNPANILETSWCATSAITGQPVKSFLHSSSPLVHIFANSTGVVPDIIVVLVNDWMFGATAWADDAVVYTSIRENLTGDVNPNSGAVLQYTTPNDFADVTVHEIGHVRPFFLLDEYTKSSPPPGPDANQIAAIDASPNLTTTLAPLKWQALADATVPPASACPGTFDVGAVPGGYSFSNGVFHPSCTCIMRADYDQPFCVVCRERLMLGLASFLTDDDPRFRREARLWTVLDSLHHASPDAKRFVINYAVSAEVPVPGQWPVEGMGELIQPNATRVIGKLIATPLPHSVEPSDLRYELTTRALTDAIIGPPTVLAEDHVELVWPPGPGARIIAVNKGKYRLTIGLIKKQ